MTLFLTNLQLSVTASLVLTVVGMYTHPLTQSLNSNLTIIGGYHGLGKHVWVVPIPEVVEMMRILFAYVLVYVVTVPLIKLSILLFYRRIFGMTYSMWFCVFLTAGYFVSCMVAFLVCCRPVSYYWTQYADPSGGVCVFNLYPFYIGNAAANVVTDGIILLVPIPLVWKLQMRKTQKVMLSGIFLLGGLYVTPTQMNLAQANISQCLYCKHYPHLLYDLPQKLGRCHLDHGRRLHLVQRRALHRHRMRLSSNITSTASVFPRSCIWH
jgi:hypothetical protein